MWSKPICKHIRHLNFSHSVLSRSTKRRLSSTSCTGSTSASFSGQEKCLNLLNSLLLLSVDLNPFLGIPPVSSSAYYVSVGYLVKGGLHSFPADSLQSCHPHCVAASEMAWQVSFALSRSAPQLQMYRCFCCCYYPDVFAHPTDEARRGRR